MYTLETNQLSHSFADGKPVLKNISMKVPEGSIYGFLGPNGAGKTTTLRLVLGLIKKQHGSISLFGKSFQQHRLELLKKTGSLIETPSLYGHLTANENLKIWQLLYRCSGNRIAEVLQTVGLTGTGAKKVSRFSLGMKQRLSIAAALLADPSLLILDEPTNGLDPYGIIEIRDLLKKLNRERGMTIIISSHLLLEIERLVTHTGIISNGQMVYEGTLADLVSRSQQASSLTLHTSDIAKTVSVIEKFNLAARPDEYGITLPLPERPVIAAINRELVIQQIEVYEMSTVKKDLETIFMQLINQTNHGQ